MKTPNPRLINALMTAFLFSGVLCCTDGKLLAQNRSSEMAGLAKALRGSWDTAEVTPDGAPAGQLWGRWVLGGQFLEIEWMLGVGQVPSRQTKLILKWDEREKGFAGWRFDSAGGEVRMSKWRSSPDPILGETTAPYDSFRLEDSGTKLTLRSGGETVSFRLKDR